MTLEELKERIERTLQKHNIDYTLVKVDSKNDVTAMINSKIDEHNLRYVYFTKPNTDLLLEAVDLECRAIKARQSSATNGID